MFHKLLQKLATLDCKNARREGKKKKQLIADHQKKRCKGNERERQIENGRKIEN